MEFNHEYALERYADVAEALGVQRRSQSDRVLALEGAARVRELTEAAGIPTASVPRALPTTRSKPWLATLWQAASCR